MIKAIIFDFDGVLVDSFKEIYKRNTETFKFFGIKTNKKIVLDCYGKPPSYVKKYLPKDISLETFYKKYFEVNKRAIYHLYPGALKLIKSLKKKYRLAILTSRYLEDVEKRVREVGIREYFEFIEGFNGKYGKPDPRVFNPLLKKLKLKANEVRYIGDMPSDYVAAKKAGIKFIAIKRVYMQKEKFIKLGLHKNRIVKNLGDVNGMLVL